MNVSGFTMLIIFLGIAIKGYALPVLWSSASGGNDHYYEIIRSPQITWFEADTAARNATYNGLQGHLATITSDTEKNFVATPAFLGASYSLYGDQIWLGAYQLNDYPGHDEDGADQNWIWITGETWNYTNWAGAEPNNGRFLPCCPEDYMAMSGGWFNTGLWFDLDPSATATGSGSEAYIIEYETSQGIPEPISLILLGTALAGLTNKMKRKNK